MPPWHRKNPKCQKCGNRWAITGKQPETHLEVSEGFFAPLYFAKFTFSEIKDFFSSLFPRIQKALSEGPDWFIYNNTDASFMAIHLFTNRPPVSNHQEADAAAWKETNSHQSNL